jgi:hypothetical protein
VADPPAGAACRPHTHEKVPLINDATRDAAQARGLAFYDLFADMGATDSMLRWYCMKPSLAMSDFVHFMPPGYTRAAQDVVTALLWIGNGGK